MKIGVFTVLFSQRPLLRAGCEILAMLVGLFGLIQQIVPFLHLAQTTIERCGFRLGVDQVDGARIMLCGTGKVAHII